MKVFEHEGENLINFENVDKNTSFSFFSHLFSYNSSRSFWVIYYLSCKWLITIFMNGNLHSIRFFWRNFYKKKELSMSK